MKFHQKSWKIFENRKISWNFIEKSINFIKNHEKFSKNREILSKNHQISSKNHEKSWNFFQKWWKMIWSRLKISTQIQSLHRVSFKKRQTFFQKNTTKNVYFFLWSPNSFVEKIILFFDSGTHVFSVLHVFLWKNDAKNDAKFFRRLAAGCWLLLAGWGACVINS